MMGKWETLDSKTKQKERIDVFLFSRKSAVWHVLGKDRQHELQHEWHAVRTKDSEFVEEYRFNLFNEYLNGLKNNPTLKGRVSKLIFLLFAIGTEKEWEKFNNKEYQIV